MSNHIYLNPYGHESGRDRLSAVSSKSYHARTEFLTKSLLISYSGNELFLLSTCGRVNAFCQPVGCGV